MTPVPLVPHPSARPLPLHAQPSRRTDSKTSDDGGRWTSKPYSSGTSPRALVRALIFCLVILLGPTLVVR